MNFKHQFKKIEPEINKNDIIDNLYNDIKDNFINYLLEHLQHKNEILSNLYSFIKNKSILAIFNHYYGFIIAKYNLDRFNIKYLYNYVCSLIYNKYRTNIINILNKKLSFISISPNEDAGMFNKAYTLKNNNELYIKLYKEMKQIIRNNINMLYSTFKDDHTSVQFINHILYYCIQHEYNILKNIKIAPIEKEAIITNIFNKHKAELKYYIDNYIKTHESSDINDKLFNDLDKYIKSNFYKIFLSFKLYKDKENNIYAHSWTDDNDYNESEYIMQYLLKNKNIILQQLKYDNISKEQWFTIINNYIHNSNIIDKIREYIGYKNDNIRRLRAQDLLNLDDDNKIGVKNSTNIDYDITNDYVRTRPFIIINDVNTNKDYVFFGPKGVAHSTYINRKLQDDMAAQNITPNNYKMGYGYLLGNIAFVDEHGDNFLIGYTLDDEVDILKKDPRIKKVYTTPGHPHPNPGQAAPITRLAKSRIFINI